MLVASDIASRGFSPSLSFSSKNTVIAFVRAVSSLSHSCFAALRRRVTWRFMNGIETVDCEKVWLLDARAIGLKAVAVDENVSGEGVGRRGSDMAQCAGRAGRLEEHGKGSVGYDQA